MDYTKENWKKIKLYMEKMGKTDNDYYKRAVAICGNNPDPYEELPEIKSDHD